MVGRGCAGIFDFVKYRGFGSLGTRKLELGTCIRVEGRLGVTVCLLECTYKSLIIIIIPAAIEDSNMCINSGGFRRLEQNVLEAGLFMYSC